MISKKIYKIGLIVLIIVNGVLIFLLTQGPPPPPKDQRSRSLIQKISKKLNLSPDQIDKYSAMAFQHREAMQSIENEQKRFVSTYFESLTSTDPSDSTSVMTNQILQLEKKKLEVTYGHFEDLKDLLNEDQQEQFEKIIKDILVVLVGGEEILPPPPRDR